jgi:hypothetical protein
MGRKSMFAALGLVALISGVARSQPNLLINGSLDVPGLHESDVATGWTLTESGAANTATFASFANNTPPPAPVGSTDQVGLWYRGFEGTTFDDPRPAVDAHLTQSVPGVPGLKYTMTGWARFEANWAGGLDFLPSGGTIDPPVPPRWPENTPSPTRTEFALEFLDAGNNVLPGSVVADLHDDLGQMNDNQWHQHMLMATAPAGTVSVQVRSSMLNGVNSDLNPQSAFVDDFSLSAIPEPASVLMGLLGLCGLLGLVRRR